MPLPDASQAKRLLLLLIAPCRAAVENTPDLCPYRRPISIPAPAGFGPIIAFRYIGYDRNCLTGYFDATVIASYPCIIKAT